MTNKITLPNGVKIIYEEVPGVRSFSIGVWVRVGSRDEKDEIAGVSHFIEHMLFKGTTNRTAKELAEALDTVGGQLNAFTSKEYTCYYAKVLDNHAELAIDVLTDMLFNSKFAEEDIEKEKNVVLEEIKMYEDTPDELVHDLLLSTMWPDHSLGRTIIGFDHVIKKLSKEKIMNYFKEYYVPTNTVISVAGSFKPDTITSKLQSIFGSWEGKPTFRQSVDAKTSPSRLIKTKETEQVHLCLGTLGLPMGHENTYVLHCLNSILGGGISSRLFQKIREERGLAYSIYSYTSAYQDNGLVSMYAGLSQNNLDQLFELISKEIKDFRTNGVTDSELYRAKEQLKGNLFLGLENVSSKMSRLGKAELCLGRVLTPEEISNRIDKVTKKELHDLANALFCRQDWSIVAIAPEGAQKIINDTNIIG